MINFASLFNQFRSNTGSAINELLDDPNTNIDRLLDEESFLNQYKSGNSKVMDYMKYNRFQDLIKYVTVVGPASDKKKGYKFPLIASDILGSDNSATIQFFFPSSDIYVDQIKTVNKEVEEEVEVDDNEAEKQPEPENKESTTIIQDKLEGQEEAPAQNTGQAPEKVLEEKKPEENSPTAMQQEVPEPKKKTKIIKKIQTVQQVQKVKKEPLIGQLFSYFEGEVNYTLAGYVSKVLISFYNKKPISVIDYFLDQNRFEAVLNHIESRSVGELVMKLLTHESTQLLEKRKIAYERILARLSLTHQVYVMSNLSICVCDIIEKVSSNIKSQNPITEFGKVFFHPSIITKVITNVMSDEENVSIYNAPVLLVYLTNAPLNIPEDKQIVQQFKTLLKTFLTSALSKLRVTRETRAALGVGRIKIIEIISFILKADILDFRMVVGENMELFSVLFNLCKNYEMNNILHNEILKMIELAISANNNAPSPFLQALVGDDLLLNFICEEAQEDMRIRSGGANRKTRKGYIGHIITICQKLLERAPENDFVRELTERNEFKKVVEDLIDKETYEQRKNLAGYALKKSPNHSIMFMKQDVIQAHLKFLSACPAPEFEPEKPLINIEHPDYEVGHIVEDPKKVIESIKEHQNAVVTDQEQEIVAGQDLNPKYWVKHIQYNLDDLMDDL